MSELIELIKRMDIKGILLTPTNNSTIQFFRYILVGGMATVIDWACLFLLTESLKIPYLLSGVIAFVAGLIVNFILSKCLVFKAATVTVSKTAEFINFAIIGVIGLGMTEVIMYLLTEQLSIHYMFSKIIATIIVLFWNYIAKKKILYRN